VIRKILLDKTQAMHMQFLRYFFVGGSAAVVDLLIFTVLVTYFDLHYAIAAFIGYMLGLAWNHFLCIIWVFESKHDRAKEIFMVFAIALGGLLWTWLILYLLIDIAGFDPIISKMISQILVLFWNFTMRKFYVFH
jgi:putative flippase GtrA